MKRKIIIIICLVIIFILSTVIVDSLRITNNLAPIFVIKKNIKNEYTEYYGIAYKIIYVNNKYTMVNLLTNYKPPIIKYFTGRITDIDNNNIIVALDQNQEAVNNNSQIKVDTVKDYNLAVGIKVKVSYEINSLEKITATNVEIIPDLVYYYEKYEITNNFANYSDINRLTLLTKLDEYITNHNESNNYIFKKYDEAYFKDNELIIINIKGNDDYEIENIYLNNNAINITCKETDETNNWSFLVEIKKEYLTDVNKIEINKE